MSKPFVKVLVAFASLGGFLFGFNTSIVSGAALQLRRDFELETVWMEGIVSGLVASASVFSVVGGMLNSRFGRRFVILLSSFVFVAGAVALSLASSKEALLVGRLVLGVGVGLVSTTTPIYISEISPSRERGLLTGVNGLFLTGGQFLACLINGAFISVTEGWRFMFGIAAFPAALQFAAFLFFPETPRWLLLQGEREKALEVMRKLMDEDEVVKEMNIIVKNQRDADNEDLRGLRVLSKMARTRWLLRALCLGCGLHLIQQIVGVNVVMYYSASIMKLGGISSDSNAVWLAALVAFVNFVFTFVGVIVVDRIGRRKLTLGSLAGIVISLAFLVVSFQLSSSTSPLVKSQTRLDLARANATGFISENSECSSAYNCAECVRLPKCGFCFQNKEGRSAVAGWCLPFGSNFCNTTFDSSLQWAKDDCPSSFAAMSVVGLVLFLAFYAPGMGTMPWTINAEIYPAWARSSANSFATCTNWTVNLVVSMTFLTLIETLSGPGVFSLYLAFSLLGFTFLYWILPETQGKTLEQVEFVFKTTT